MQEYDYDFLVFIGRFQPFHKGHLHVVNQGLDKAKQLIVLCGSAHLPRTLRNPFTFEEREQMMRQAINPADQNRVIFAPLMDIPYRDELWVRNVQATVNGLVTAHHPMPHQPAKIGLIGHSKDHTSYYLSLFPQWGNVNVDNKNGLNATNIRLKYFHHEMNTTELHQELPENVLNQLDDFASHDDYQAIVQEQVFINKYRQAWEAAPYAPTFVTVDAVVVQSGHVLLVERKAHPGKGQLALPGGFINQNERLVDACLRELREETRLKVPAPVLKGHIKENRVFDDPNRSTRGRTITHAFYIELEADKKLPKVRGGDDAKHAMWVPLADLDPRNMFEDHYFIIQELINA
jgi:bifunctional NMN adenylyltransferase/nudix hydrolase